MAPGTRSHLLLNSRALPHNILIQRCRLRLFQQRAGHPPNRQQLRVACRNPTLPSTAAVSTAVDKSPSYARLVAVAPAGNLPNAATPPPGARPDQERPARGSQ